MNRFPYINIEGNEYELGAQIGKIFQEDIQENIEFVKEKMDNPYIKKDFDIVKSKIENQYPEQLQHVFGRADGAGVNRDLYLLFLCYELWEDRDPEHCSDIMIRQGDHIVMGHNEDGPYTKRNSAFIKYNIDGMYFFDYSTPDALAGASFGFNSYGLVYSMNYMYIENMRRTEIPVWFLARKIITCKSITEIKKKLERFEIASGFHFNLFIDGKAYSIEGKFNRAEIVEVDGVFVHTNHYVNASFDEGYAPPEANTLFRYAKIKALFAKKGIKKYTTDDIEEILSYRAESYYNSILSEEDMKRNITACTVLFDSAAKTIKLINRVENKQHIFSLDAVK